MKFIYLNPLIMYLTDKKIIKLLEENGECYCRANFNRIKEKIGDVITCYYFDDDEKKIVKIRHKQRYEIKDHDFFVKFIKSNKGNVVPTYEYIKNRSEDEINSDKKMIECGNRYFVLLEKVE